MAQSKSCSPSCNAFKCAKNAVFYRRDSIWCRETDENCTVAKCMYSMCVKRRLLPGAVCGETVKRKTVEREDLDGGGDDFKAESIKLKGKALRKLGDQEYY